MVIPGILIMTGDGLLFTMVAGYIITVMAGPGFPDTNGDLHGYPGVREADNTDGHHSARELVLVLVSIYR